MRRISPHFGCLAFETGEDWTGARWRHGALADGKSDLVNVSVVCVAHLLTVVHSFRRPWRYLGGGAVDVVIMSDIRLLARTKRGRGLRPYATISTNCNHTKKVLQVYALAVPRCSSTQAQQYGGKIKLTGGKNGNFVHFGCCQVLVWPCGWADCFPSAERSTCYRPDMCL